MADVLIRCLPTENVYQAFDRCVRDGTFAAGAKLFPLQVGVPGPEAPAGYVTVARIMSRSAPVTDGSSRAVASCFFLTASGTRTGCLKVPSFTVAAIDAITRGDACTRA